MGSFPAIRGYGQFNCQGTGAVWQTLFALWIYSKCEHKPSFVECTKVGEAHCLRRGLLILSPCAG